LNDLESINKKATGRRKLEDANSRFNKGIEKYEEIFGPGSSKGVKQLGELGRYVAEFSYGDVYSRSGLSLRDREIAAIAMLASRTGVNDMLRIHIKGAMNVGLTYQEIEEIIIQSALFSGFASAIQSLVVLKEFEKK
jgi:4-carboxymuconolactone decarboxylase